jgi:hypothetical protein
VLPIDDGEFEAAGDDKFAEFRAIDLRPCAIGDLTCGQRRLGAIFQDIQVRPLA